jgi:hypothetical protein
MLGALNIMKAEVPPVKIRNGAYYYDLLNSTGTTHLSSCVYSDTKKYTLTESTFSIQAVTDSWKYGAELQFVSWSRKPPILERRSKDNSEYYRFEAGYMPLTHETAQQLRKVADNIDAIIGYSEPTVSVSFRSREIKNLAEIMV